MIQSEKMGRKNRDEWHKLSKNGTHTCAHDHHPYITQIDGLHPFPCQRSDQGRKISPSESVNE